MKEKEKIDSKIFMRGLSGSLVFRIFLIEATLLVAPLLIFAGVIYYEDTDLKRDSDLFALELVLEGKKALIEQVIRAEGDFLSYLHKIQLNQQDLERVTHQHSSLAYLVREPKGYICVRSSDPKLVGVDFSYLIPKNLVTESVLEWGDVVEKREEKFYFLQPFSGGMGVGVNAFSPAQLEERLAFNEEVPYPTIISLLAEDGSVLLSTHPDWVDRKIPSALARNVKFTLDKVEYIGKFSKIRRSNLFLLTAGPVGKNFVDIPYFVEKMFALLLIILAVGGGSTLWLTFRLGKPLRNLCLAMERVRSADLSARYVADPMGFEINVVGMIFNAMIKSLINFVDRIRYEKSAKETFERELIIGQEVQTSIFPKQLPRVPGLDIAARFIAAKEVGGDFYDFLIYPDRSGNRLFFSIADTSGKGVYACMYSLTIRSMLRSYAGVYDDLGAVVRKTNDLFCVDTGDSGVFVTAWLAFFNESTRELFYTNCGHFPAYLMRADGKIEKLTTRGMAFGVEEFSEVRTMSVRLREGDTLLLFTDGVVEAHDRNLRMFGEKRLLSLLKAKRGLPASLLVDEIVDEVISFAEDGPQYDDITILVLRMTNPSSS
ncbi:MAG: SpoIIE family protein phosphatase [Simkaniaceae bacterium]|nr:SpoIIE family protein phosphatase [Simkaniaceae bacterium]